MGGNISSGNFRGANSSGGNLMGENFQSGSFRGGGGGSGEFSEYHFKPIGNCSIKIHYVYFKNLNILFKTAFHQKIYFLTTQIFF